MKIDSIPHQNSLINKYCYLIILALLLFHIINNYIIITNDNTPLLWDGGDYFYRSLRYYDVFANFDSNFISQFNDVSRYRPPLFMLSSLPLYLIFGRSTDVAVMTNIIYLIILILSVYGIGRKIHSREAGLMAAFIVSVFPIIFGLSRSYWQDFPLAAMVSLSIYLLIRTDYFRNKKYSVLFGLSMGLGMLTKWTYFVFLMGPFLYIFTLSLKMNEEFHEERKRPFLNFIIAIFVGMAVASLWYVPNGLDIAGKLFGLSTGIAGKGDDATKFQQLGETIGPSGIFSIKSLTFYAGQLINHQITFIYSVLFVIFIYVFLKKADKKTIWILLLWIVIPIIAFTFIKNKTLRNTVPILPAVGLMISLGILNIRTPWTKKIVIAIVLFIGLYQYMIISYGSSYLPKRLALRTSIGDVIFFQQYENFSYALFRANSGDWKADEILEIINANRGKNNDVKIVLIPRDPLTWMAMEYTSYLKKMPFTFIGAIDYPESVLHSDYVLIKKGGFLAPWFGMDNIHRALDLVEENIGNFTFIKSVVLPEEYVFLSIYDIKAAKKGRKSGVIFSNKVEIIDYAVSETSEGLSKEFKVDSTLKVLEEMGGGLKVGFRLLDKKLDVLMEKRVEPLPLIAEWKMGEVKTINASLTVPPYVASELFSLEIGLYDSSKCEYLKYQPEYLIYKRIGSQ